MGYSNCCALATDREGGECRRKEYSVHGSVILLGIAIYLKVCKLLDGLRDLAVLNQRYEQTCNWGH